MSLCPLFLARIAAARSVRLWRMERKRNCGKPVWKLNLLQIFYLNTAYKKCYSFLYYGEQY